jgi:hypothetical protein
VVTVGQDATEAFYGLHRHEILMKPQYRRLQIGILVGEKSVIHGRIAGELSKVPYAEPTWLADGYHSPYYTEVACFLLLSLALLVLTRNAFFKNHRKFQKAVRKFFDEVVLSDALVCGVQRSLKLNYTTCSQAREDDGKPPSKDVIEAMA